MNQGRALPAVPGEEVDFLLPTGLMITLTSVTPASSLRQLKDRVYQEAKKYPLFSLLKDQGFYNFLGKCCIRTYVACCRHTAGWLCCRHHSRRGARGVCGRGIVFVRTQPLCSRLALPSLA